MDEKTWLDRANPQAMLEYLRDSGRASARKARLFACACVRRIWPLVLDERCRGVVDVVERFAEGTASTEELTKAYADAVAGSQGAAAIAALHTAKDVAARPVPPWSADYADYVAAQASQAAVEAARFVAANAAEAAADAAAAEAYLKTRNAALAEQCRMLRCVFGSLPFRPAPSLDPTWLSPAVVGVARHACAERDFAALPILADALQEAGCDNEEILRHCRQPDAVHVRGCWVLDWLGGKE